MRRKKRDYQWLDYINAISDNDCRLMLIEIMGYMMDLGCDSDVRYTPHCDPDDPDDHGRDECFYWSVCGEPVIKAKRVK